MDGNIVGLAAVVMIFGIPMAAMYTFFRVRKLRSEERLAAIARGMDVPMQQELSESARSISDNPCKSPDCPPERVRNSMDENGSSTPRGLR